MNSIGSDFDQGNNHNQFVSTLHHKQDQFYEDMLRTAFTHKDNSIRQNAESRLIQIAQQDNESVETLLRIVNSASTETESASIFIITLIKKCIQGIAPYVLQTRMQHVAAILNTIIAVPVKLKLNLLQALQQIVNYDKENHIKSRLMFQLQQLTETRQIPQIEQGLYIAQTLVQTQMLNISYLDHIFFVMPDELHVLQAKTYLLICEKYFKIKDSVGSQPIQLQDSLLLSQRFKEVLQLLYMRPNVESMIVECLYYIYAVLLKNRTAYQYEQSPFYSLLDYVVQDCLVKLFSGSTADANTHLKILVLISRLPKYYVTLSETRFTLLLDVIYPFVRTSSDENDQILSDPNEFVNLAIDTVDEQESDVLKTTCAKLMQSLCLRIDGFNKIASQMVIMICSHAIVDECQQLNTKDTESLKEFMDKQIFQLPNATRIETSLMLLTIMYPSIQHRKDILALIEMFLRQFAQYFLDTRIDMLVRCRLCLFLGKYLNLIFLKGALTEYQVFFAFLVKQITFTHESLMYQAADSIQRILEHEDSKEKLGQFIPQLMLSLCTQLKDCDYPQIYDLIILTLKQYSNFISEEVLFMGIKMIVAKILNDQSQLHIQSDKQMSINLAWNILKTLPEIDSFQNLIPQFEIQIFPLYQLLIDPTGVDFDEDIFVIVSEFIRKTSSISECQLSLFQYCPNILAKYQYRLGQLFDMFNNFIVYGQQVFQSLELQNSLINMLLQVIQSKNDTNNDADRSEGALLLQLMIQNIPVPEEHLVVIFQTTIQIYKQVEVPFFKSRLIGVFLSAIYTNPVRSIQIFQNLGLQFMDIFTQANQFCQPGYDTKLYVIAMTGLIQVYPELLNYQILDAVISVLLKQFKHEELNKLKDDDDQFFEEVVEEAKMSLDIFQSKVKEVDEFSMFRSIAKQWPLQHPQLAIVLSINRIDGQARKMLGMVRKKKQQE